jgi:ubiquinol-cytochrome c reductase iron-sulfur subunit
VKRWLIALLVYLLAKRKRQPVFDEHGRIVEAQPSSPRAELLVLGLLGATAGLAVAFVVVYATNADTQLLGLCLGAAFLCLCAASVVTARKLVPDEEDEEEYSPPAHPQELEEIEQILDESGQRVTRARLLKVAAGGAGAALGAALVVPAFSLGPVLDTDRLFRTPWRAGRRLVDADGRPVRADEITERSFVTAFPEGADRKLIGSPVVVVRVPVEELDLPEGREDWAPDGLLAYSKICTHAGCAVSLYRSPNFTPVSPKRALVCPCHYSTFDVARGADVLFGPAGRALPQLPLRVDDDGHLVAGGDFSDGVGPSWWGSRQR